MKTVTLKLITTTCSASLLSLALTTIGCTKTAEELDDGSLKFSGITGVELSANGSYLLRWDDARGSAKDIVYKVYMANYQAASIEGSGTQISLEAQNRSAFITTSLPEVSPVDGGILLNRGLKGTNAMEVDMLLDSAFTYGFQVVSTDETGAVAGKDSILFLASGEGNSPSGGCVDAVAVNQSSAKIFFNFPAGAKEVAVFRDGILIERVLSPTQTVVVDNDILPGIEYLYECRTTYGSEIVRGAVQRVKTVNPLVGYQGCDEATFDADGRVKISYIHTDKEVQIAVYRDDVLVHEGTSPSKTSFTDYNAVPGETHTYTCVAEAATLSQEGSRKLKVSVPQIFASFNGCFRASPLGGSQVKVEFFYPDGAERLVVTRDGSPIFSTVNPAETYYIDTGRIEGRTYRYNCEAYAGAQVKRGAEDIEVTTLSTNPPDFAGIQALEALSPRSMKVKWGVVGANGVAAAYFRLFITPGFLVDFNAPPAKEIPTGVLEQVIDNLGDQMPYAVGVRACSEQHVCDENTKMMTIVMADDGAPRTEGIKAVTTVNGKVVLTAPWTHSMGAVRKRVIYQNFSGGSDLAHYNKIKTEVIGDLTKTPQAVTLSGIVDNTTYYFILIDEDPNGVATAVHEPIQYKTGDLTAPGFPGIAALKMGSPNAKDTTLTMEFSSIGFESVSGGPGAQQYLVYYTDNSTADPCTRSAPDQTILAKDYDTGTVVSKVLTGLKSRTTYRVCVKAQDAGGNISATTAFLSRSTQDVTAPGFDGITTKQHNSQSGKFDIYWQPSASPDISQYMIKLWKNTLVPPDNVLIMAKSSATYPSGVAVSQSEFQYVGGDKIYVSVAACDNAQLILDGIQNCTDYMATSPYTVPDITPPLDFEGIILSPTSHPRPGEGKIDVTWKAPHDWTGYLGFKIFTVDLNANPANPEAALTFIKSCQCSALNCPLPISSCLLEDLDIGRSYTLHVRAFDDNNNNTTYLNPFYSNTTIKTLDLTPPAFAAGLSANIQGQAVRLTWNAAVDNQYINEPGAKLTYRVFRKSGSAITNLNNPKAEPGVTEISILENETSFKDETVGSNITYHYTVCVEDGSQNKTCAGMSLPIQTPDITPPTVAFTSPASAKIDEPDLKKWGLTWTMSDNSPINTLSIKLYTYLAGTGAGAETPPDRSIFLAEIPQTLPPNSTFVVDLSGPANTDTWIHYYIEVSDVAGNIGYDFASVFSENEVLVNSIHPSSGKSTGGQFVTIEGKGFSDSTVTIGGVECNDVKIHTKTFLTCYLPALAPGLHVVRVENPDNAGSDDLSGFTSLAVSNSVCDSVANGTGEVGTVKFQSGAGTSASPWTICTKAQLNAIRFQSVSPMKYYKLAANIDLSPEIDPVSFPPISNGSNFLQGASIDGNAFTLANFTYSALGENYVGLFRRLAGAHVININFAGFDVEGNDYVGGISGGADYSSGCSFNLTNVRVIGGRARGRTYVAGGIGYGVYVTANNVSVEKTLISATAGTNGGVYGYIASCSHQNIKSSAIITTPNALYSSNHYFGGVTGRISNGALVICEFTGKITGPNYYVGGIVGLLHNAPATVDKCTNKGSIAGHNYVGGIVGYATGGQVKNSANYGSVKATANHAGGAIGYLNAANGAFSMEKVRNYGPVEGTRYVGGITSVQTKGAYESVTSGVENHGRVAGQSEVGGILGYMSCNSNSTCITTNAFIRWAKNTGLITATSTAGNGFGGIVGTTSLTTQALQIENVANEGDIYAPGNSRVGGLVGNFHGGNIKDAYSTGKVTGLDQVGSAFGYMYAQMSTGVEIRYIVERVFSTGKVTGEDPGSVNGFKGAYRTYTGATPGEVISSFWDVTSTGQAQDKTGGGNPTGLTTAALKQIGTYLSAGWPAAGVGVWEYPANQYPRLVGWPE